LSILELITLTYSTLYDIIKLAQMIMPKKLYESNIFDTLKQYFTPVVKFFALFIFLTLTLQIINIIYFPTNKDLASLNKGQMWIPSYSPTIGNKDSKLALVYFYDFQCGFCKDNDLKLSQVQESKKDKMLFVYRNLPLQEIHPYAEMAARSAMAVHRQSPEKFFTYKKEVFSKQNQLGPALLEEVAKNSQIDITRWNRDKNDRSLNDEIRADVKFITDSTLPKSSLQNKEKLAGSNIGTPTSIILKDGKPVDWWSGSIESSQQIKIIEKYL
jgi:thiol-disulfide isomerase/thioredoxin